MKTLRELMEDWKEYKKLENSVTEQRRQVETEMYKIMMKQVKFPNEGTTNHIEGNLKLKIISKLDYKVDQDAAAAITFLSTRSCISFLLIERIFLSLSVSCL